MSTPNKNGQKKHSRAVYACTIICSFLFIFWGHQLYAGNSGFFNASDRADVVTAKVTTILNKSYGQEEQIDVGSVASVQVVFEAQILKGEQKGTLVKALQQNGGFSPNYLKEAVVNDRVLLHKIAEQEDGIQWVMQDYIRSDALLVLFIVFLGFLLLFGRGKGLNTIISLVFTCLAIFTVFVPAILSGHNIYLATILVSVFIIAMSLMIVIGPNKKSLASGIGCLCGLTVSGLLMLAMDVFLKLTGIVDEESIYLLSINPGNPMDLKAIIFASVVIGALGATLDISVSIASSLNEICETSDRLTFSSLVKSGVNIGRDILGTMTNTLLLAYIGSSLSLVLLLIVYSNSLAELLNRELVVVEILHALVGSIGILFAIPLTSVFWALFYEKSRR